MSDNLPYKHLVLLVLLIVSLLTACIQGDNPEIAPTAEPTRTAVHTPTRAATATTTVTPTPIPDEPNSQAAVQPASPTPTASPALAVCSPLADIPLAELAGTVGNPFNPPAPGSDDPHQGVDLADRLPGSQVTLTGRSVQAVTRGQVAGVIQDRFPYGNAVILEVPLTEIELDTLGIILPTPLAAPLVHPVLTCPQVDSPYPAGAGRSLYFLYAHMAENSDLQPGQQVGCGEQVGRVGDSGNALNPHLHLEVRAGPSQARFDSLAHYDNRATQTEMGLYCLWRVSGIFQLMDPGLFLTLEP